MVEVKNLNALKASALVLSRNTPIHARIELYGAAVGSLSV